VYKIFKQNIHSGVTIDYMGIELKKLYSESVKIYIYVVLDELFYTSTSTRKNTILEIYLRGKIYSTFLLNVHTI